MTNTAVEKLIDPKGPLVAWAKKMKKLYGYPVYLVGSAMWKPKPRDIDVCCILPDAEFKKKYGIKGSIANHVSKKISGNWDSSHWVWSADVVKRVLEGWEEVQENLDFKVISECENRKQQYSDKEKILISG